MQTQTDTQTKKSKHPILLTGLLFAIGLGGIEILLIIVANLTQSELANAAFIIIALVVFLLAGRHAAVQTGVLSTGTFAGLLTAIMSATILFVGNMIFTEANVELLRQIYQAASDTSAIGNHVGNPYLYTDAVIVEVAITTGVVCLVLSVFGGLVFGTIGGYLGSLRYYDS